MHIYVYKYIVHIHIHICTCMYREGPIIWFGMPCLITNACSIPTHFQGCRGICFRSSCDLVPSCALANIIGPFIMQAAFAISNISWRSQLIALTSELRSHVSEFHLRLYCVQACSPFHITCSISH